MRNNINIPKNSEICIRQDKDSSIRVSKGFGVLILSHNGTTVVCNVFCRLG